MFSARHGCGSQFNTSGRRAGPPSTPLSRPSTGVRFRGLSAPGNPLITESSLTVAAQQVERRGCAVRLVVPGRHRGLAAGKTGWPMSARSSNPALEREEDSTETSVPVEIGGYHSFFSSGAKVHFLEETDEGVLSRRMLSLGRSNKIRSALELFASMTAAGLRPDGHACNSLLSCLVRNGYLNDALTVFEVMRKGEMATGHSFSLILKAVAQMNGFDSAIGLFMDVEGEGLAKGIFDVVVYNTMLSVCARGKKWVEAEHVWKRLKESGCSGTMVTYRLLVSTFVQCGQAELALAAYNEMIQNGLHPDEDVMKAMVAVCTKDGNWASGLSMFHQMLDSGIRPSVVAYNALINCLGKAGECDLAFKIYDLMRSYGQPPDVYTWNALLSALYRCRRYADALRLFERIRRENLELNVHLYNIALTSCQRLGLWDRSLQLLWKMEESGILVPTASYNLVIHACERAKQPKVSMQVYQHMVHKKCMPDTFTYLSLIRTCIWGSLWNEVEDIMEHVALNASLYNAIIQGFCLRGKITLAKKLYGKMRSSGLEPDGKTRAFMLQHLANDSVRQSLGKPSIQVS